MKRADKGLQTLSEISIRVGWDLKRQKKLKERERKHYDNPGLKSVQCEESKVLFIA